MGEIKGVFLPSPPPDFPRELALRLVTKSLRTGSNPKTKRKHFAYVYALYNTFVFL